MRSLMQRSGKTIAIAVTLGSVAVALYLLWLWQPARQLLLHQRDLLHNAEKRDWKDVAAFMDGSYRDRWGFDKSNAVRAASEVLRQFFVLSIVVGDLGASAYGDSGVVFARFTLDGEGTAVAQEAARRVNALRKPFRFEWRRVSWKPWDWKLISVDQPELTIPAGFEYF